MPVIIPPSRDRLGESIVEAEAAGATADTMRIVTLRWGVKALEVSQEVYDRWAGEHPDAAGTQDPPTTDTSDADAPDPEPGDPDPEASETDADTDPDGDASGTNRTRKRGGTTRRH